MAEEEHDQNTAIEDGSKAALARLGKPQQVYLIETNPSAFNELMIPRRRKLLKK